MPVEQCIQVQGCINLHGPESCDDYYGQGVQQCYIFEFDRTFTEKVMYTH